MKMICPKSETCKRDYCGVGEHCDEHERKDSCDVPADSCPACVEVKEPKKEKVGVITKYWIFATNTTHAGRVKSGP